MFESFLRRKGHTVNHFVIQAFRAMTVVLSIGASTAAYASPPDRHARSPAASAVTAPRTVSHAVPRYATPVVHGPGVHRPHRYSHGPSVRVWFGAPPIYYAPTPYWAYPPYVYRHVPPVVVVPAAPPPVYVERGAEPRTLEAPQAGYWYWCDSRAAYHPQAPDCPEGWVRVAPQPSATQ